MMIYHYFFVFILTIAAFQRAAEDKHSRLSTRARRSDDAAALHKLDATAGAGAPSKQGAEHQSLATT